MKLHDSQDDLARIAFEQGDADRARSLYQEAFNTRTRIGEKAAAAYSQTGLATIEVEQGSAEAAASLAGSAVREFRRDHRKEELALAEALLAKALWREGKKVEACDELARLSPLLAAQEDRVAHIGSVIKAAPVQAACSGSGAALKSLTEALREARQDGFMRLEWEAEIELAAQDLKAGKTSAGHGGLARVCEAASRMGYVRIAARCRDLLRA